MQSTKFLRPLRYVDRRFFSTNFDKRFNTPLNNLFLINARSASALPFDTPEPEEKPKSFLGHVKSCGELIVFIFGTFIACSIIEHYRISLEKKITENEIKILELDYKGKIATLKEQVLELNAKQLLKNYTPPTVASNDTEAKSGKFHPIYYSITFKLTQHRN